MSGKIIEPDRTDEREPTDKIKEVTECCADGACCWQNTPAQSDEKDKGGV